jgi:hypothetical protein
MIHAERIILKGTPPVVLVREAIQYMESSGLASNPERFKRGRFSLYFAASDVYFLDFISSDSGKQPTGKSSVPVNSAVGRSTAS